MPLPKLRSNSRVYPSVIFYTLLIMEFCFGCSAGVQSTQINQDLPPPPCDQQQVDFYRKSSTHLNEYVDNFINEIDKISVLKGNFQLEIRRSQFMIAFGEDLIRRLGLLESILSCDPLHDQYLADRQLLFNKLEGLIQSQSAP